MLSTTFLYGAASRNRTHIHGVEDRCIIRYTMAANYFGGRLESRTLKGLLSLDGFQDRFHRQLDWPSVIHTNLSKFYINELYSNYSIVCCQLSIIAQSAIGVNCFIVHCHVSISNILLLSCGSPCSA